MTYKTAFPDFPEPLPEIEGFEDISFKDDICPSLGKEIEPDVYLTLFVDYPNPEMRECGGYRYKLFIQDVGKDDFLCVTEDLEKMKFFINGYLKGIGK
jgi:hypothetical protein